MGSRKTHEGGVEYVYEAAQKWVDCALRDDGSLFTPGNAHLVKSVAGRKCESGLLDQAGRGW